MNPDNPSIAQGFKAGDKLAGCYTLKEILPDQGYCVVWLAHDEELGKDIALHFVPDSVAADTRARGELKQEAKRNRQLIHPRIVRVHDMVEDEKWVAISMDHVQGETLAALQKKQDKNALAPSALTAGISELCQTLEDAHRIDLFHRDLAPENLLATANGLMVQKFGLSRVILDCLARNGKKLEGARDIVFASPQQLDGKASSRADDIYSLGACLFALLTGTPPFAKGDIGAQIRKDVPQLTSHRRTAMGIGGEPVPPAWDETIAACLAKSPDERPKTAAEAGTRFAAGKAGSSTVAPAVAAAAVAAAEPAASKPEPAPSGQEAAAKQQKRPWGVGPGKAPVITEATVLSNTPVPKAETKSEGGAEPSAGKPAEPAEAGSDAGGAKKSGPTTPSGFPLRAFVEVEGDQKSPKEKSSGGLLIAGVVLVLILVVGYLVARNNGSTPNDSGETAAVPTPANLGVGASPAESAAPTAAPEASQPPEAQPAPPQPAPVVAASATPAPAEPVAEAPVPVTGLASMTDAQVEQLVAAKTKAVEQAKASLDDAEKASNDKAAAQAKAATALQELQGSIKQKTDSAAAAKKAADAAAATLKQQQDGLQKAEADAQDAQKAAAAKAQAADQLRKTVADAQAAAQQQQAAQQQAEADATQAAKLISDRQQAADAAGKAAADAEKARQQQAQALAQAQANLGQVQAGIQQIQQNQAAVKARKAAADAARLKQQREAETSKLAAQAAAAVKAAQDAQKALDAARQAVADAEKAQQEAERQAQAAQQATPSMALPAPTAVPVASPASPLIPASTPPPSAAASPAASVASPTLSVRGPNPHLKVDQALGNSLGMRFAPVGKIFFSVWLTRVQDFEAFATATGYKGTAWRDPGFKQAPDHPVVNVSWNDANQFCLWLTEKEHHDGILSANETYRLPTDLEWSNAVGLPAESGRTPESRDMDVPDVYPWGTQWPPPAGAGNYTGEETDSDVAIKGYNDGFAWTSPIGSFNANKFGLFDMGGNVWEWCEDWWNGDQKAKVLRGGSWYNGALKLSLLSSCRIHANADEGTDNYGFRVILAEETTKPAKRHALAGAASPSARRQ